MDMVLGVAVASVLILFSVTLRAGIGATWLNRLGAKPRHPEAPDVTPEMAIDAMDPATTSLTTVLRAADIPSAAATPPAGHPPRRPAPLPRRAHRDPRTARSRAAGPAGAVRQPLRPAEHDRLCALLEACSIVPAQREAEDAAPAAGSSSMAETIVHSPQREALASEPVAAAAEDDQAEDESRRAVEEVFAIAAQLRRRSEDEARATARAGADPEAGWRTKDPSPATREVTIIADELAQRWAVEAVNRAAEQARIDTEARLAASRSGAPAAGFDPTGPGRVHPASDHAPARPAGRELGRSA
jgi:hypothetical protein